MAPIVGGVLGLLLVTSLTNPAVVWQGYILLAAVSVSCIGLFLLVLREYPLRPHEVAPFHWHSFLSGFVRPLAHRDFTCVLLSRGLIFLSFTLLGAYTFFYLSQALHMTPGAAAFGVTTFQLISNGALIVSAWGTRCAAERVQRLKPFLMGEALLMATGLSIIALLPVWSAILLAAIFFGGGFGAFVGLDIALAIQVLPHATERGKDLGILHTAIFVPLIVSSLIGAAILNTVHSFAMLFAVAAFASLLAALFILSVKSVR